VREITAATFHQQVGAKSKEPEGRQQKAKLKKV
jgi:hypothetical protein